MNDRFVVTVRMDTESARRLDSLRRRYFPPERNFLSAHVTLFHALSEEHCELLRRIIPLQGWSPISLAFGRPHLTGRGVAIPVAGELAACHAKMLSHLPRDELTRQDQQARHPHVTIQNKVTPHTAEITLKEISRDFQPWTGLGFGIEFWRYLGGPWDAHAYVPFA